MGPTPTLSEQIDFSKSTVRNHLHGLEADGFIEKDDYYKAHKWRLTDAGYERLADADETLNAEDGIYIWKEVDQTDV